MAFILLGSEIPQKQIEQISTKFCDPLVGPTVLDTVRAYFYIETNPVREKEVVAMLVFLLVKISATYVN